MNKAFDYYTKCAILSCNLKDYSSVISCYKTVLELINIKTINPVIQQFWIFLAANANQQCGNFKEASYLWRKLINWERSNMIYSAKVATSFAWRKVRYVLRIMRWNPIVKTVMAGRISRFVNFRRGKLQSWLRWKFPTVLNNWSINVMKLCSISRKEVCRTADGRLLSESCEVWHSFYKKACKVKTSIENCYDQKKT